MKDFLIGILALIVAVILIIAVPIGFISFLYWIVCLLLGWVFYFPFVLIAYIILVGARFAYRFITKKNKD